MKQFYVYILTNKPYGTFYVGITSDLIKRIYQHKYDVYSGFTSRYNVKKLVYFEIHNDFYSAVKREKLIKKWRRKFKIELILRENPKWRDFYEDLLI